MEPFHYHELILQTLPPTYQKEERKTYVYSDAFRKEVLQSIQEEGATYYSVAKHYGLSRDTIWKWCKKEGITLHSQKHHSEEKKEEALNRIRNGSSYVQTGKDMNISWRTIRSWCEKAHVLPARTHAQPVYSEEMKEYCVRRVAEGEMYLTVAQSVGVSQRAILNWCQKKGVRSSHSRGPRLKIKKK